MKSKPMGNPRKLTAILTGIFLFSVVMGPGPGLYLVNPDTADAGVRLLGAPILYTWAVFWFIVQASVIVVAYFTLWKEERP